MNSIELMVEEHKYILRMLAVVRKACSKLLLGEEISYNDFEEMIEFITKYADQHHHGKEEKFLFKEMVDHLGKMGTNLVTHAMLVEHDWGRLFIIELKAAIVRVQSGDDESRLDIIANAIGYANHLARHIAKEDAVVYTFAAKNLAPEILDRIDMQSDIFEKEALKQGTQAHFIELLEKLEKKYL